MLGDGRLPFQVSPSRIGSQEFGALFAVRNHRQVARHKQPSPGRFIVRKYSLSVVLQFLVMLALGLLVMSCSGTPTSPGGSFDTPEGSGYMFIGDAPPAGTSILRFDITLASAT